jgi:hypothetical protein
VAEAHPFRERFWAQLMLALYRCGRQAEALAAYQRVRSLLVDQLGIEPGPELRALEAAVLAHDPTLAWTPPGAAADDDAAAAAAAEPPAPEPPLPETSAAASRLDRHLTGGNGSTAHAARLPLPAALAHPAHDRVLAGRHRERTLLADAYAIARAGHFAAVFLGGPPGIGKTALAAWFARQAHAGGATVVLGRADEVSPGPFRPLGEAIAHWAQHRRVRPTGGPGDHARLDADDVALLARIVPRLRPRPAATTTTVAPASDPGGDDQDRLRLFDATARWVEELAAEAAAPPVILLDDLQWADTGTLLAVRHLLRHPPGAGALLLVTHRDVDLGDGHDLLDLLAGVRGDGPARRVVLGGLAPTDVVALLPSPGPTLATTTTTTPAATGSDHLGLADELVRVTGGNPLFVHETLRYLDERGGVAAGVDPVTGVLRLDRIGVPDGVKEVIERRLRRLPATTTSLLRWAAVLGDRVDRPVLARLVDRPELDVMAAVEPAVTAGLATPDDAGWSFAHALVREAIADGLGQAEQARAHWKAGGVLQARPEVDRSAVARHLTAGVTAGGPGAVVAAVDANARAGQAAMVSLAFEESLDHYETAVELLGRTTADGATAATDDAGTDGQDAGHGHGGARDRGPWAPAGVDPDLVFRCWFGLGMSGGAMADRRRQRDGYLRAAQVAREQAWPQRLADAVIGFVAYVGTAGVGSNTPETSTFHDDERLAQELLRDALSLAGEAPSATRCTLLAIATTQARMLDRSAEARALADEALASAEALDEPTALPHARVTQLWSRLGEPFDPALREAPRALLAFDPGPELRVSLRVFVLPVLPMAALQLGDRAAYDDVRRWVTDDPNTWRSTHLRSYLRMWDTAMALAEGRFDEALHLAATPLPGAEGWGAWSVTCMVQRIVAAVEIGDPTARARLEMFVTMTPPPHPPVALAMAASVAAAAGDGAAARRHVAELRSQRSYDDLGWGAPLALRHLAEAAAHLGDAGLAATLLPVAERYEGQLLVSYTGTTIDGAGSRIAGQLLLVLGRLDEAVDRLRAGHDLERAFGADGLAARTGYWLARALLARRGLGDAAAAERLVATTLRSADRLGMSLLGRALRLLPAPGEEAPARHAAQPRQTRQTRQSPQAPAEAARRPA